MQKRLDICSILCIVVLMCLFATGCQKANAVAEVNGEIITQAEFDEYWENLEKIYEASGEEMSDDLEDTLVKQMIYDELLNQTAEKLDCVPDDDEAQAYYEEQLEADYGSVEEAQSIMGTYGIPESFFLYQYTIRLTEENIIAIIEKDQTVTVTEKEAEEILAENEEAYEDLEFDSHDELIDYIITEQTEANRTSLLTSYMAGVEDASDITIY